MWTSFQNGFKIQRKCAREWKFLKSEFQKIKFKMIHSSKYLSSVVQCYLYQKCLEVHQFPSFCVNSKYNIEGQVHSWRIKKSINCTSHKSRVINRLSNNLSKQNISPAIKTMKIYRKFFLKIIICIWVR